jgi:hypothetical protein
VRCSPIWRSWKSPAWDRMPLRRGPFQLSSRNHLVHFWALIAGRIKSLSSWFPWQITRMQMCVYLLVGHDDKLALICLIEVYSCLYLNLTSFSFAFRNGWMSTPIRTAAWSPWFSSSKSTSTGKRLKPKYNLQQKKSSRRSSKSSANQQVWILYLY